MKIINKINQLTIYIYMYIHILKIYKSIYIDKYKTSKLLFFGKCIYINLT